MLKYNNTHIKNKNKYMGGPNRINANSENLNGKEGDSSKSKRIKGLIKQFPVIGPIINKPKSKEKLSELEVLTSLVTKSILKFIPEINQEMISNQVQKIETGKVSELSLEESSYLNLTIAFVEYFKKIDFKSLADEDLDNIIIEEMDPDLIDRISKQYCVMMNNNFGDSLKQNLNLSIEAVNSILSFNLKGELITFLEALSEDNKKLFIQSCIDHIQLNIFKVKVKIDKISYKTDTESFIELIELLATLTEDEKQKILNGEEINLIDLKKPRTEEELKEVKPVSIGEKEANQISMFNEVSNSFQSIGYQLTQPSSMYISNFNNPDYYCLINFFKSGDYNSKVGVANNQLIIVLKFKNDKFEETKFLDIAKYDSSQVLIKDVQRIVNSYKERTTLKLEQEPITPSKDSYKGQYIVRYGIESNTGTDTLIRDQIVILTDDDRSEELKSNLISKDYSKPYLNRPAENPLFFLHEVSHALATGIVYHGFSQFIEKLKPKDSTANQSKQTFSILGEGVVAALTGELFNNRFNASTRGFNHTILLTEFYVKYIFDILNEGSKDYKKNPIIADYLYERNHGHKNFSTYSQNSYKVSNKPHNDPLSKIQMQVSNMKEQLEDAYISQKHKHIPSGLDSDEKDKQTESDIVLDFDFSQSRLFEVIEGIDKLDFTSKFFLSILKSIKSAKELWATQTFTDNCIENLKVKSDEGQQFGPVDEDAANNFKLWYNSLETTEQEEFTTWLKKYIQDKKSEKSIDSFVNQCSEIFENIDSINEPGSAPVLQTKKYSQSLIDIGGVSAIF